MSTPELLAWLAATWQTDRYAPGERGGLYSGAEEGTIRRIGLALEPFPGLADWVRSGALDALWLHRPWQTDLSPLPETLPILYHHLPFDEHLTLGYNLPLAGELGLVGLEELGYKQAEGLPPRPIGMQGAAPERSLADWIHHLGVAFGGYDEVIGEPSRPVAQLAVVGAMNDALVREAAGRGAGLYVTGQFRQPARKAVAETGMAVLTIGHRRSEEWGLRALGRMIGDRWPDLQVTWPDDAT